MKRCLENILFGISCKIQAPTVDLETSLDKKKEHADYCVCVGGGGGNLLSKETPSDQRLTEKKITRSFLMLWRMLLKVIFRRDFEASLCYIYKIMAMAHTSF